MVNKQYYFSVEPYPDPDELGVDGGLLVVISPKDYTDKEHCGYDQHLSDELDPILSKLPFMLSEDAEAQFSVYDWSDDPGVIPETQIDWVRKELIKAGFIEKDPETWLD